MISIDAPPRLQPLVRRKVTSLGVAGQQWVVALPEIIGELERRWSVRCPGGTGLPGGSTSYVSRVTHTDGRELVLKISIPSYPVDREAAALGESGGEGYAHLEAYAPERNAILMESLGGAVERSGRTPDDQLELLWRVLGHAWSRPMADLDRARLADEPDKVRSLAESITTFWTDLDRPCPEAVVAQALRYAEQRAAAHDPQRCVWVHGDPHPGNLLATKEPRPGAPEGFVFVDPDAFVDDPCYDLGVTLRDWCSQLGGPDPVGWLRQRCARAATLTGQDAETIWQWAYVERVSTGLYVASFGADPLARTFLDTAARLVVR